MGRDGYCGQSYLTHFKVLLLRSKPHSWDNGGSVGCKRQLHSASRIFPNDCLVA